MPIYSAFSLVKQEDAVLSISMTPPQPIGGWHLQFDLLRRFNSDVPLFSASWVSGQAGGASGITIVNSGAGQFVVRLPAIATSGWQCLDYAYAARRTNSGAQTMLSEGFLTILPGVG